MATTNTAPKTAPTKAITKVVLEPGMKIALEQNGVPLTAEQLNGENLVVTKAGDSLMVTMPDGSQTELVDFFITDDVTLEGDFWDLPADSGLVQTAGGVVAQPAAMAQAADTGVLGEEAIATDASATDIAEGVAEVVAETAPAVGAGGFGGVLAGLAGLGLAAGGGGGAAEATTVADTILSVGIFAGPLTADNQLTIAAYGANGEPLQAAKAVELVDGRVTVSFRGDYRGAVLLKVVDNGDGTDYINEVDGQPIDLGADLRAIIQVDGTTATMAVNISPLTEIVVQRIVGDDGADGGQSNTDLLEVTPDAISAANTEVASKLRLPDSGEIALMEVKTTIDAGGQPATDANKVGQVLAAISGYETTLSDGTGTAGALLALKAAIAADAGGDGSSATAIQLLAAGAAVVLNTVGLVNVFETVSPTVSGVVIAGATGLQNNTLNAGDVVSVTLTMSEAVMVTGTPQLALMIGQTSVNASYVSGSASTTLMFTYTILADQTDLDGIAIVGDSLNLNGGSIKDAAGNAATLTHNAVVDNAGFLVDTTAPTPALAVPIGADLFVNATDTSLALVYTDALMAAGDVIQLKLGDATLGDPYTVTSADLTARSVTLTISKSDLGADGDKSITAQVTDAAGNIGTSVATIMTLDSALPTITTQSLSVEENATAVGTLEGSDTTGVTWKLDGTGADDSKFSITAGGVLTLNAPQNFEALGSAAGSNAYAVKVAATDAAGNVTTQGITVNVTDVNDAPTAINSIAPQTAVLNQAAWTLNLASYFVDVDAGDTPSYAITTGTLPDGLSLNTTTGVINGTPTVEANSGSYTVTMTDSGGLTASQTFSLAVLSAPELTTALSSAVTNLDVRSKIVFSVGETVTANEGGTITLTDLGGAGFRGEARDHTQEIDITDTTRVQIVGTGADTKIIVDPQFDLDLSSNYSLDVSVGAFQGADSGQASVAFSTVNFSTVTPGVAGYSGAVTNAVASSIMDANGELIANNINWVDIEGIGNIANRDPISVDLSAKDYMLVFQDGHEAPLDPNSGVMLQLNTTTFAIFNEFDANDRFYVDEQTNDIANINDLFYVALGDDGAGATTWYVDGTDFSDGSSQLLISFDTVLPYVESVQQFSDKVNATSDVIILG